LAQALDEDARPENRAYIYDHFVDNCSTKPRDLIDEVSGGALQAMPAGESVTYRKLVDERLGYSNVLIMSSDLGLGRHLDKAITPYEAMFLPKELRAAVAQQLGSAEEVVYRRQAPLPPGRAQQARRLLWFMSLGFAFLAGISILKGSARVVTAARIAVGAVFGGLGTLLLLMAIVSPEPEIRWNENILVFLATDLLFVCVKRDWLRFYALVRLGALGLVGLAAAAGTLLQPMGPFWCAAVISMAALALWNGGPKKPIKEVSPAAS
jgi:hypothetical protein